eukprot:TRINITY_DN8890_c0_g2_i2.p3 TRINITY_DN8890_c0_g2~~TRINITY_DN8890_c0_g2_i2.p3  ORF type:complete len:362 (-),score=78.59 TRINITY_DN8890_c0_g2_i2:4238-5323(-)
MEEVKQLILIVPLLVSSVARLVIILKIVLKGGWMRYVNLADEEDDGEHEDPSGEPKYDDDDEVEYEEIGPEKGDCLVIQRALTTQKFEDDEEWLRSNIFKTRCKSHGKACSIEIDGWSCENIVSQEMVDKLKLNTEPHSKPYRISWFKKGNEVKFTKRCLVSFSMGKNYHDNVWCDVVPMDVCHILLGRPWQYDRHVTHDGRKNTYTFRMGKVDIVLLPCKEERVRKTVTKEGSNNFLALSKFMKESKESGVVYMLVAKEKEQSFEVPYEVEAILEEFKDVIPNELPSGLPPLRDIQHQLDLIPGSSLPNKAHYRMSPKEHEELNRQVMELLEKGYIREFESLCSAGSFNSKERWTVENVH